MIRILIAEDSPVQRELLVFLLDEDGGFDIVGTAKDGVEAVEMTARLRPDIVLMDYHMPEMDGDQATRRIMETSPTPIVIMSASVVAEEVAPTFETLCNGALAMLVKPVDIDAAAHEELVARMIRTLKLMAEVKVVGRRTGARRAPDPKLLSTQRQRAPRIVAIGGSTGAPGAIAEILAVLPAEGRLPVIVVQHMAAGFAAGFATWLDQKLPVPVRLAEAGRRVEAGVVHIAPDERQLGVNASGLIELLPCCGEGGFCPSIDYTFRSVAAAYSDDALGVLLSGMGRDGVAGLSEIRTAGGLTVAQDGATSVVFGMPAVAIEEGAAQHVLPPPEIGKLLAQIAESANLV